VHARAIAGKGSNAGTTDSEKLSVAGAAATCGVTRTVTEAWLQLPLCFSQHGCLDATQYAGHTPAMRMIAANKTRTSARIGL
jgi:hypothetical protein